MKEEIKKMLKDLGISRSFFKRTMPLMSGSGFEYTRVKEVRGGRGSGGHKPSLKQQFSFLQDLVAANAEMREQMLEQKRFIEEDQAKKSGPQAAQVIPEEVSEDLLMGNVKSIFDRK